MCSEKFKFWGLSEFSEDLGDMLLSYFCFNDFCFLQGWLDLLLLLATG